MEAVMNRKSLLASIVKPKATKKEGVASIRDDEVRAGKQGKQGEQGKQGKKVFLIFALCF